MEAKVTAVVKNFPRNSHIQFDALLSFSSLKGDWLNNYGNYTLCTYLLLKNGTDYRALQTKFPDFLKKYSPAFSENFVYYLQPLRAIHLHSKNINYQMNWNQMDSGYIRIFTAVATLIMLIACINFMNLSTARSVKRAKEVGLRKVLGSSRKQLIRQFIGESVFMSACSILLAFVLIELTIPCLNEYFGNIFDFDYSTNGIFLLEFAGIALLAGVLAGIYPAFILSSFKPAAVLSSLKQAGNRGSWLRRSLIVLQFSISIILLIYTFFVGRQIEYMRNRDMGFDKKQVVVLPMSGDMNSKFEFLRHELLANPSVTGITASRQPLGEEFNQNVINFEGKPAGEHWNVANLAVDYDFIPFYGLKLIAGRDFSQNAAGDSSISYILSESLVKKIGWSAESAVGRPFELDGASGTVTGVIKDFNFYSLQHAIEPIILAYDPYNAGVYHTLNVASVRIRPENMAATLEFLKNTWSRHSPASPYSYSFLDEDFAHKYESETVVGRITGTFSGLAVLIACLGLLGLISFAAENRTKEIGIRKVLGASVPDIVHLLSLEFMLLLGTAILIAWPVAWFVTDRWLQNFAYRIDMEWYTFALAGAIALAVAAVTVSFQAVRAATANPVDSLRHE